MVKEGTTRVLHHEAEDRKPLDGRGDVAEENQLGDVLDVGDHLSENK